jgi:uncharacterized membrane protein
VDYEEGRLKINALHATWHMKIGSTFWMSHFSCMFVIGAQVSVLGVWHSDQCNSTEISEYFLIESMHRSFTDQYSLCGGSLAEKLMAF